MIADILTVMWKERKGLLRYQGRRWQAIVALLSPALVAIVSPLSSGEYWLNEALAVLLAAIMATLVVSMAIPDSFAGERERHTLETLLASRLSDRAILIGKIVLPIAVGWGITLVVLALSLITYNLAYWQGTFVFFALPVGLGSVTISLMLALLTAGAGVLISLRAPSVQEAQQTLMSIILLPPVLLSVVLTMVVSSFSDTLGGIIESIDFTQVVLIVDGVLFILSVVLFLAALARFQRSRLYAG